MLSGNSRHRAARGLATNQTLVEPAHRLAAKYRLMVEDVAARRPFVMLFAAGALSTLSMAPFHFWPILFFTLPPLLWAIDGAAAAGFAKGWKAAAWRGWAFGFGYQPGGA